MTNPDTRVQFTKSRFHSAMLDLLEQQPIGTISVKSLCEKAGLNRGTFYLHYSEPIDVLKEMEWALFDRVLNNSSNYEPGLDISSYIKKNLSNLESERRLCAAVIGHNGDPHFLHEVHDKAYAMRKDSLFSKNPGHSEEEIKMLFHFLYSGITGAITVWLKNETALSTLETAELISRFVSDIENIYSKQ